MIFGSTRNYVTPNVRPYQQLTVPVIVILVVLVFEGPWNHPNFPLPSGPPETDYPLISHLNDVECEDSSQMSLFRLACWVSRMARDLTESWQNNSYSFLILALGWVGADREALLSSAVSWVAAASETLMALVYISHHRGRGTLTARTRKSEVRHVAADPK